MREGRKESAGKPEDPQFCHEVNTCWSIFTYDAKARACQAPLLLPSPSSFSFLGSLPFPVGGLDRWLRLARLRLNACVYTCKFSFFEDGGDEEA